MFETVKFMIRNDLDNEQYVDHIAEDLERELTEMEFMEERFEKYRKDSEILTALKEEGIELTDFWKKAWERLEGDF